ncbi:MAG: tetratricopeptide repeat protein [Reyranella sp.]|uniref:tetratricopeptide repeat protein n=1 Tax=Reyranella sp. TaxID=1929291 RepID=UPI001AD029E2|nr:tetratricopeptide repeat protein [Reyranella sp.]MBN9088296.1 tetratricopeptide repeat protein [Reyranella sp.]
MWRFLSVTAISAGLSLMPFVAEAQRAGDTEAFRQAFQETLQKPTDAPTLLKYARIAVQVGDLEAAVSAYERFLMIDADQPRVRYELGVLYYRLRSYEAARAYFETARASPKAGADVKSGAGEYIAEIEKRTGTSRFSGDVLAGLRFSSNANNANSGALKFFGNTVVPNPAFSQRGDVAAIGAAQLRHRYDFGRQDSGTLETDLGVYASRQFQVSEANTLLLDLTTGPRSQPFEGAFRDVTLKPFVTGRYVSVHDKPTYWSWGAGMEGTTLLRDWLKLSTVVLGRRREFIDNADAPTNSRSSGNDAAIAMQLQAEVAPDMLVVLGINATRYIASIASESYRELGFGGSLTVRFADPVGLNGRKWYLTGSAAGAFAGYDAADPTIDPNVTRSQADLNLGLLLSVPLDDRFNLIGQTTYFQRTAPIGNYAFQAFNGLVGVSWRF